MRILLAVRLAVAGLTLLVSAEAGATVTLAFVNGQRHVTDSVTNLKWLSPIDTRGLSVNTMKSRLLPGQQYAGWRYATMSEVQDMMSRNFQLPTFEVSYTGTQGNTYRTRLNNLINFFGDTWGAAGQPFVSFYDMVWGMILNGYNNNTAYNGISMGWHFSTSRFTADYTAALGQNETHQGIGHWLVQTAEVLPSPPVADAGGPYGISNIDGRVTFGGSSSDPDNDIATRIWTNAVPTQIGTGNTPTVDIGQVGITQPGQSVTVGFTVTDAGGRSASDTATVSYTNTAPSGAVISGGRLSAGGVDGLIIDGTDADFVGNQYVNGFERLTGTTSLGGAIRSATNDVTGAGPLSRTITITEAFSLPDAIAAGLVNTAGSVTIGGTVVDRSGASRNAQAITLDYDNHDPLATGLLASFDPAQVTLDLSGGFADDDLVGNGLIGGFERLDYEFRIVSGGLLGSGSYTGASPAGVIDLSFGADEILALFGGSGLFQLSFCVRDALGSGFNACSFAEVEIALPVPAPALAPLLALAGLALARRPRAALA